VSPAAAAIRDFAAIGQIPAQALGIDGISNISDATFAGLEAAKNREAGEITTSLGESHEQLLRLCAYIDGNQAAADDYNSEVRWRDFEARSYAADDRRAGQAGHDARARPGDRARGRAWHDRAAPRRVLRRPYVASRALVLEALRNAGGNGPAA
jgi:hypothetical protein